MLCLFSYFEIFCNYFVFTNSLIVDQNLKYFGKIFRFVSNKMAKSVNVIRLDHIRFHANQF